MSEAEFRNVCWHSVTKRIIAEIEQFSSGWAPNGPSKATAAAILNKIRTMPVPTQEVPT